MEESGEEHEELEYVYNYANPLVILGIQGGKIYFVESKDKTQHTIPSEVAQTESLPLDSVFMPQTEKVYKSESFYLSAQLKRLTGRFVRETYPFSLQNSKPHLNSKLASKVGEGQYRNVRGMLLRGLDHKAMLACTDIRDQTSYDRSIELMQKLGLCDLVKKVGVLGTERDDGAIGGKRIGGQERDIREIMREQEGSRFKRAVRPVGSATGSEVLRMGSGALKKRQNFESQKSEDKYRNSKPYVSEVGHKSSSHGNRFYKFLNSKTEKNSESTLPKIDTAPNQEKVKIIEESSNEEEEEKENDRRLKRRQKRSRLFGKLNDLTLDDSQKQKVYQ